MWIQKLTPFAVIYLSYLYVDIRMYIANWAAFIATTKIYIHTESHLDDFCVTKSQPSKRPIGKFQRPIQM